MHYQVMKQSLFQFERYLSNTNGRWCADHSLLWSQLHRRKAIQHPDDKNAEDITLNRPPKLVKPVLIQRSPSPDFKPTVWKNGRKTPPPFSQSCSEKGGETGEGGVGPQKPRRHPHRLRRLHRLFSGRFEKLSVFGRPTLSRRLGKYHPPHHGPAQNLSANGSAEGAVWTQNAAFTAFATFRMAGFEKCRTIFSKISFLGHEIFLPGTLLNLGMVFMGL